ncbi:MAG: tellurite resistance TerB family protein [Acidobacteriota bacterium]
MDINKLLGQVLGSPAASGFAGGMAGGLASQMLTSRRGRKMGKKALKVGGLAALGGLAYHAYQKHQESKAAGTAAPTPAFSASVPPVPTSAPPALPAPRGEELTAAGFMPDAVDAAATNSVGLLMLRTMIAAARADGKLDSEESQAIFGRVEELDLSAEEKATLFEELNRSTSIDDLAAAAHTPQLATEVYLAALMAIETDTDVERRWLDRLARKLNLDDRLVIELEAQVDVEA